MFFDKEKYPVCAGSFYPQDKDKLDLMLESFLLNSKPCLYDKTNNLMAIIAPHAGYVFSGQTMADSYNQLKNQTHKKNYIVIAPSHYESFNGIVMPNYDNFITPLGSLPVNKNIIYKINKFNFAAINNKPYQKEHSIEVQLPFIQKLSKNRKIYITPILTSKTNIFDLSQIIELFWNKENIFIISSDLSHYNTYCSAIKNDLATISCIQNKEFKQIDGEMACGHSGISAVLNTAKKMNLKIKEISYSNSGDTKFGDKKRVVGYFACCIGDNDNLSLSEDVKKNLLSIARLSINKQLKEDKLFEKHDESLELNLPLGTFVTIKDEKNNLLGCIGNIFGSIDLPVSKSVYLNAMRSAFKDSRFNPIKSLKGVKIIISILFNFEKIYHNSKIDIKNNIKMNTDGLILKFSEKNSATFLPSVWNEITTKDEFLINLKNKAGINEDDWYSKEIEVIKYKTLEFY